MVITKVGQVGIKTPEKSYKLVPSLAAIASLPNPTETYSALASPNTPYSERMDAAYSIILACSDCKTIKQYLGRQQVGKTRVRGNKITKTYTDTFIDDVHALHIAENLLYHGMVGDIKSRRVAKETDKTSEFDPLEWVAAVIAHLGISEQQAWQMTMTSILTALRTKFPPSAKELAQEKQLEEKAEFNAWYSSIYGEAK